VPRLYLATPEVDDPSSLAAGLPGLLAAADVAAVLLRLKPTDQRSMISRVKALAPAIQDKGAALLLDGHVELVARSGADYVLFGEPDARGQRPSIEAIAERVQWWSELFEPPCVGFAASREEVFEFAAAGADFVLVGDLIWNDARGAAAALMDVEQAIRQGYAAMPVKAKAEQG
jgi:thiamine-phosphate pyrophosphorylase